MHTDASGGDRVVAARGLVIPRFYQQGWSPDGTQLTYSSYIEGGIPEGLRRPGRRFRGQPGRGSLAACQDPAWSPDGRSIAFDGGSAATAPVEPNDPAKYGLYVMDADGSNVRLVSQVTDSTSVFFPMPLWSPDSSSIVTFAGDTVRADAS